MSKFSSDIEWCERVANMVADALIDAKLIAKPDFERARDCAKEENFVRISMGDLPR
jgi:hypothetical protein